MSVELRSSPLLALQLFLHGKGEIGWRGIDPSHNVSGVAEPISGRLCLNKQTHEAGRLFHGGAFCCNPGVAPTVPSTPAGYVDRRAGPHSLDVEIGSQIIK
jgi:hypothetical protein